MFFNGKEYTEEQVMAMLTQQEDFIGKLKTEKASLEGEVTSLNTKTQQSLSLEQALALMGQQQQPVQTPPPTQPDPVVEQPVDVQAMVAEQVKQSLAAQLQQQQAEKNLFDAMEVAKQHYGDEYTTKLEERAASMNMDADGVMNLARSNPALFKQALIPQQAPPQPTPHATKQGYFTAPEPALDEVIVDFADTSKFWDGASKVNALNEMQATIMAQIESGKLQL